MNDAVIVAPRPRQRDVNALGLTVLVVYGVTYYAIGTVAPLVAAEFGVGVDVIFAAFSVALLANAAIAAHAGRLADRMGCGRLMVLGLFGRAVALVAMTFAFDAWTFSAALIVVMLFSQVTEYDIAFAAVVERAGVAARSGISQITLWGGIASTIFWPLTLSLLEVLSWRDVFRLYAALLAGMAALIWVVVGTARHARDTAAGQPVSSGEPAVVAPQKRLPLIWLTVALSLTSVAMALPVILMPVLTGLGFGASAVIAGAVFGPAQTGARMLEFLVSSRISASLVAVFATALLPIALLLLVLGPPGVVVAVAFAVLYGAGNGIAYVNRGTVALQLFGSGDYAALLGRMAVYRLIVAAAMPFLLAVIMERLGMAIAIYFCAGAGVLATLCFMHLHRRYGHISPPGA